MFRAELDELARRRGADVHYLLGEQGEQLGPRALRSLVPDVVDRDVYLCGPPGMAEVVRASLRRLGLPAQHLHEERFAW